MNETQIAVNKAKTDGYYIKPLKTSDGYYIARQVDVDNALPHRGAVDIPCITVYCDDIESHGAEHVIYAAIGELNSALAVRGAPCR
jgi:hypothetical protein